MGGGVIRSVTKAVPSGAFRSVLTDEAGRRAAWQKVSSFVPAVGHELVGPTLSAGQGGTEDPAVTVAACWPELEFGEWELTGGREESSDSVNVAPRLIFGPAPTLEEAQEAAADLKDALEKAYFTPQRTLESHEVCNATAVGECGTISAAPKHVTQMLSLLQGNSQVQGIVASLASDENVLSAIMKNEKVVQFLKNNSSPGISQMYEEPAESVAENKAPDEFLQTIEVGEASEGFFLDNIKVKVSNTTGLIKIKVSRMVDNVIDLVKDFPWISKSESSSSSKASMSSMFDNTSMSIGALIAVVAVILLVILKRGR